MGTCQDIVAHAQLSRAIKKEKKKVQVVRERHVLNFFFFFGFEKREKKKVKMTWRVVSYARVVSESRFVLIHV